MHNIRLTLSHRNVIERLPDRPWTAKQVAQVVQAFKTADIPTQLNHRIGIMQQSLDDLNTKHDQQVQDDEEDQV
jgi:hypothetical protein